MREISIYVEIYDYRVVIVNPGELPLGITKSNFGKGSIKINLIIADLQELIFESGNFFRAIFTEIQSFCLKKPMELWIKRG